MATWRKPGRRPAAGAPAGERGERWWPVATAIIVVAGLHVALPARYRVQPAWVVPVVLLLLLAVLIGGDPGRIDPQENRPPGGTRPGLRVLPGARPLGPGPPVGGILADHQQVPP